MGGGLMQLVAYGAQDIYLTGNPQITFFKVVYRRHTNFSMEAIKQSFTGSTTMGGDATATISRNGDLISRIYLEADLSFATGIICANAGTALIDYAECEIGGQRIDKQYGHWMETYSELTESNPTGAQGLQTTTAGLDATQEHTLYQRMSNSGGVTGKSGSTVIPKFFVPLQFWFCRNPGLALPLIALQYHEVKIKLSFAATTKVSTTTETLSAALWCDYIYLDTDERRRFAQVSHEYLIEQVQFQSFSGDLNMNLNFNHPVKELIWTGGTTAGTVAATTSTSTPTAVGLGKWKLKLNGHDRFAERNYTYFTRTQVWQHHTGYGGTSNADSIAVYSFALKPEEHQPSGTCNFSRIDNAELSTTVASTLCNIYAINYNVLRIMSGMGGLAYSN